MEFETLPEMYRPRSDTRESLAGCHVERAGRWVTVTWRAFEQKMTAFALGLMALGMEARKAGSLKGSLFE